MARFGFCGGFYTSQSILAECQAVMNWYPETVESGVGKSSTVLYPTPGLSVFSNLGAKANRGCLPVNGRAFFVSGDALYELKADGTNVNCGVVANDFQPVTMATNGSAGNQLAVCSAGQVFVFYLADSPNHPKGTLVGPIGGIQGQATQLVFCDGYGVVSIRNTSKFQISHLEDMTTWDPLSVQQISVFPENIGAIISAYRQLWIFGLNGHSQVYYNSGANPLTPFDVIPGAFMEEGINAPLSLCIIDNAPFWIGGNANGAGIAWRANGYTPQRISNFAIETVWATYPSKGSDAIGYAYRDQGHSFWVLRFPSANNGFGATWVYDVASQMWHERGFWSQEGFTGYSAHLSTCHCFCFGKHLVGDWQSGNVYAMDIATATDNGKEIRRYRRAPHISTEQQRIFHQQMQLDLQVGTAPVPPLLDGQGNPREPQIMLRWSNDSGLTWSNEHWIGVGQAGAYLTRVMWNRLGYARDRIYEVAVTDPIAWRIIDAYLSAKPGFERPTERYSKQLAKEA